MNKSRQVVELMVAQSKAVHASVQDHSVRAQVDFGQVNDSVESLKETGQKLKVWFEIQHKLRWLCLVSSKSGDGAKAQPLQDTGSTPLARETVLPREPSKIRSQHLLKSQRQVSWRVPPRCRFFARPRLKVSAVRQSALLLSSEVLAQSSAAEVTKTLFENSMNVPLLRAAAPQDLTATLPTTGIPVGMTDAILKDPSAESCLKDITRTHLENSTKVQLFREAAPQVVTLTSPSSGTSVGSTDAHLADPHA